MVDRDPIEGTALASQLTLSRFENAAGPKVLYRMGETLADAVIKRQRRAHRKAKRITVELDPTDDPTHGAQQLALFNGHYDTWCYLPVAGFIRFDEQPEQYLFTYVLLGGRAPAKVGATGILKRVFARLRAAFPKAKLRVRLDGGFAGPQRFDFLEAEGVEYVIAMAGNTVLDRLAEPAMKRARAASKRSGQTQHVYTECCYAAKSWGVKRRVIIKAEMVRLEGRTPRDNPRYVVTNLTAGPKHLYENVYCQRGEIENRIKELHTAWKSTGPAARVLGQSAASSAHRSRVCADAGAARSRGRHRLRASTGVDLARAAAQARRLGRALGAPHRLASAATRTLAIRVVPGGAQPRRSVRS